jgi:hypothetical protein
LCGKLTFNFTQEILKNDKNVKKCQVTKVIGFNIPKEPIKGDTTIVEKENVISFEVRNLTMNYIPSGLNILFPNLLNLTINYAHLKGFDQGDISNLPNLIDIDFSDNDLKKLCNSTFDSNKNLKSLNLSRNKINSVDQEAFAGPTWTSISFSGNKCFNQDIIPAVRQPEKQFLQMLLNNCSNTDLSIECKESTEISEPETEAPVTSAHAFFESLDENFIKSPEGMIIVIQFIIIMILCLIITCKRMCCCCAQKEPEVYDNIKPVSHRIDNFVKPIQPKIRSDDIQVIYSQPEDRITSGECKNEFVDYAEPYVSQYDEYSTYAEIPAKTLIVDDEDYADVNFTNTANESDYQEINCNPGVENVYQEINIKDPENESDYQEIDEIKAEIKKKEENPIYAEVDKSKKTSGSLRKTPK